MGEGMLDTHEMKCSLFVCLLQGDVMWYYVYCAC
jgi:hypothetical protein